MTQSPTLPLQWSDEFALNVPLIDSTHIEFVDLLGSVVKSEDSALLTHWLKLVAHTEEHFAREDRWMLATGFSPENCHSTQHKIILQIMKEGAVRGESGALDVIRQMADELGMWFPQHAQNMDAGLAAHLTNLGFDPESGAQLSRGLLPSTPIMGCHAPDCSGLRDAPGLAAIEA